MARRDPGAFIDSFGSVARTLSGVATRALAKFDVGTTQAKFLHHIGRHSRVSQADLARATATDPALTGRVLEPLIERGWVRRARSPEDRRQYVLELAPAGQRMRKRVDEARAQVGAHIVAALDNRDLEDFDRIAQKILAAVGDGGDA